MFGYKLIYYELLNQILPTTTRKSSSCGRPIAAGAKTAAIGRPIAARIGPAAVQEIYCGGLQRRANVPP